MYKHKQRKNKKKNNLRKNREKKKKNHARNILELHKTELWSSNTLPIWAGPQPKLLKV